MKGDLLKEKARIHLQALYEEDPLSFQYNESELFRRSGVSRVTLSRWKKAGLIDEWMREFPAAHRVTRHKQNELIKEIERLRSQKGLLKSELDSLRNQLCDFYEYLNAQSIEVRFLSEQIGKRSNSQAVPCPLCGHTKIY